MFRVFRVRPFLTVALTIVSIVCIGNLALADIVLCPTAVVASSFDPTYGVSFDQTIDNSGLSAAVNSGVAPATWPTGYAAADQDPPTYYGRFYDDGSYPLTAAALDYTVPTSITGYSTLKITGIRLWQYSESWSGTYYNNRGIASALVKYSTDGGSNWSTGQTVNFTIAPETPTADSQLVALSGLPTGVNQIKLENMTTLGSTNFLGFNEVRFMAVPEPSTLALLTTSLLGLLAYAWRKRK